MQCHNRSPDCLLMQRMLNTMVTCPEVNHNFGIPGIKFLSVPVRIIFAPAHGRLQYIQFVHEM